MSDIRGRVSTVPLRAVSRRRSVGWVRCCNWGCGCGGYGGSRGGRHSNDRPSRGLLLLLLLLLVVTQGGRCVADTVPVRRQPGQVGIDKIDPRMMSKYQQLTWQEVGWQGRGWRLNGGTVGHEETETARFVLTAVCPTETLSFFGLH